MGRTVRWLHIADSHLGAGVRRGSSVPQEADRSQDLVASFHAAVARARQFDVDFVIFAGDLFDTVTPPTFAIAAATEGLLNLAREGIPVVLIPGNHDRTALEGLLLTSHAGIHYFPTPGTATLRVAGAAIAIGGIPAVDQPETFEFAIAETRWWEARADLTLLACHEAFVGAACGAHDYRFRGGADGGIAPTVIPPGIAHVATGHVHRHQVLRGGAAGDISLAYSGATDRISFAERLEPKGVVLTSLVDGTTVSEFVEHDVRPMVLEPIDVTGKTAKALLEALREKIAALPHRALAEFRLSGSARPGQLAGLRLTSWARSVRRDVLIRIQSQGIRPVPERVARARGADLDAHSTAPRVRREASPAFAAIGCDAAESRNVPVAAMREVPNLCGTYALYDEERRLLYIGKAAHLRSRVRTHLRSLEKGNFFAGWGRVAAFIEYRRAASDLEATLVEAAAIARLQPPFNRQFRDWNDLHYLTAAPGKFEQLWISRDPTPRQLNYGPFARRFGTTQILDLVNGFFGAAQCELPPRRSRRNLPLLGAGSAAELCERFFAGRCAGPCAGRVSERDYAARVAARHAFLSGRDDALLAAWEAALCAQEAPENDPRCETARWLRATFDRAKHLLQARAWCGSRVTLTTDGGAHFDIRPDGLWFGPVDAAERAPAGVHAPAEDVVIPKPLAEPLLALARAVARGAQLAVTPCAGGSDGWSDPYLSAGRRRAGDVDEDCRLTVPVARREQRIDLFEFRGG